VTAAPEQRQQRERDAPGAEEVGVQRLGDDPEVGGGGALPGVIVDGGVVHQDIDSSRALAEPLRDPCDGRGVRHVELHGQDVVTLAREQPGRGGALRRIPGAEDHAVAAAGELARDFETDAPVSAGNDNRAGQICHAPIVPVPTSGDLASR